MARRLLTTRMIRAGEQRSATEPQEKKESHVDIAAFLTGMIAGIATGVLIAGFLALGAYNRGYADALFRRKDWRAELVARQAVASRARQPGPRESG